MTPKQWNLVVICHEESATKSEPHQKINRIQEWIKANRPPTSWQLLMGKKSLLNAPSLRSKPLIVIGVFPSFHLHAMTSATFRFARIPTNRQTVKIPKGRSWHLADQRLCPLKKHRDGRNLGGLVDNLSYTYVWYIYIYIYKYVIYLLIYIYIYMW